MTFANAQLNSKYKRPFIQPKLTIGQPGKFVMNPYNSNSRPMEQLNDKNDGLKMKSDAFTSDSGKKEKSLKVEFSKNINNEARLSFLDKLIRDLGEFTGYDLTIINEKNRKVEIKLSQSLENDGTSTTAKGILDERLKGNNTLEIFVGTVEDIQQKTKDYTIPDSIFYKDKVYLNIGNTKEKTISSRNEDNFVNIVNESNEKGKELSKEQIKALKSKYQLYTIEIEGNIKASKNSVLDKNSVLEHNDTVDPNLVSQKTRGAAMDYLHELLHYSDPKKHPNKRGVTDEHINQINKIRKEHEENTGESMGQRIDHFHSKLAPFVMYYERLQEDKDTYGKQNPEEEEFLIKQKDNYKLASELLNNDFDFDYQIWEKDGKVYFLYPK